MVDAHDQCRAQSAPLLTLETQLAIQRAAREGAPWVECTLDLGRSTTRVELVEGGWVWRSQRYPFIERCKERTIYVWDTTEFRPASRYSGSLFKLIPTEWGPPTFEIDGIKMLPTSRVSPYEDARRKVELIEPRGKAILDTCGGLGYFAAWCLQLEAERIVSFEKSRDVLWLRTLNPWSPEGSGESDARLSVELADVAQRIDTLATASFDAVLHDPPRFGIAGELYSQTFYDALARVLKRNGRLFHYTGTPNALTSRRDVPREVANRLARAGFKTSLKMDGVLAQKK